MKDKYQEIKDHVSKMSVDELISLFNAQVGKQGWSSARAAHDSALIDALIEKGIDVSAIYDGKTISFAKKISLAEGCKIVTL